MSSDMPSRRQEVRNAGPAGSQSGSALHDPRMVLPEVGLDGLDPSAFSVGDYAPKVVRGRSILEEEEAAGSTPVSDPSASTRAASDPRIYIPPSVVRTTEGDSADGYDMFAEHSAPIVSTAPVSVPPANLEASSVPAASVGPVIEERDFGAQGGAGIDGDRVRAVVSEGRLSKRELRRKKKEEKALRAAEARKAQAEEKRKRAEEQIRAENEAAKKKAEQDNAAVLARNLEDAKRREEAEAKKRARTEAKRLRAEQRAQRKAKKGATQTPEGAPSPAPQAVQAPQPPAEPSKKDQRAQAKAAEQERKRKAEQERQAAKEQARVDAKRVKEAERLATRHARERRKADVRLAKAETRRVLEGVRIAKRQQAADEKARRLKEKEAARVEREGANLRSVGVKRGRGLGLLSRKRGKDTQQEADGAAPLDTLAGPLAATHTSSLVYQPEPGREQGPAAHGPLKTAPSPAPVAASAPASAAAPVTGSAPAQPSVPAVAALAPAPTTTEVPMSRRERRAQQLASTQEERDIMDKAERSLDLRELSETIKNEQTIEARRRYQTALEAIEAEAKSREIEMAHKGLSVAEEERKRLRRSGLMLGAGVGVLVLGIGAAVGLFLMDTSSQAAGNGQPSAGASETQGLPHIVGPEGEVISLARAYVSDECGPALVVSAIGPATADEPGSLEGLTYTFDGEDMPLAYSAEPCWMDLDLYAGVASSHVLYLDGTAAAQPRSASISLDGQVSAWEAPEGVVKDEPAVPGPEAPESQPVPELIDGEQPGVVDDDLPGPPEPAAEDGDAPTTDDSVNE